MSKNRLFQMLFYLLENCNATAPELAKQFEVSVRTIYRDIDQLSAAGVPIYTTQGKGGGISIKENYIINKSLISEQEQNQILLGLQGMEIVNDQEISDLITKLGGLFQKQNITWLEIDFSDWQQKSEAAFDLLKNAIFEQKIIEFDYYTGKGKMSHRLVEPLKLVLKSRDWYLYGYCQLRQDYRLFKLLRMKKIKKHRKDLLVLLEKKQF